MLLHLSDTSITFNLLLTKHLISLAVRFLKLSLHGLLTSLKLFSLLTQTFGVLSHNLVSLLGLSKLCCKNAVMSYLILTMSVNEVINLLTPSLIFRVFFFQVLQVFFLNRVQGFSDVVIHVCCSLLTASILQLTDCIIIFRFNLIIDITLDIVNLIFMFTTELVRIVLLSHTSAIFADLIELFFPLLLQFFLTFAHHTVNIVSGRSTSIPNHIVELSKLIIAVFNISVLLQLFSSTAEQVEELLTSFEQVLLMQALHLNVRILGHLVQVQVQPAVAAIFVEWNIWIRVQELSIKRVSRHFKT